jgi:hypothetical protein
MSESSSPHPVARPCHTTRFQSRLCYRKSDSGRHGSKGRTESPSGKLFDEPFGANWNSSLHSRRIAINTKTSTAYVARGDSRVVTFIFRGGVWKSDDDVVDRLTQTKNPGGNTIGWVYYDAATDDTEQYSGDGALLSITNRANCPIF